MEQAEKKAVRFIKSNIMNFVVIVVALSYVFFNMITIKQNDVSLIERLCGSFIGIVAGLMIKQGLGENGFAKGYNSQTWQEESEKYNTACGSVNEYMERVDNFYDAQITEMKKRYRQTNLNGARLKYSTFFDEDGNYIEHDIHIYYHTFLFIKKRRKQEGKMNITWHQYKVLKKCVRVKVYNLNLFSEYENTIDNYTRPEQSDKNQRTKMFGKNSISQVLVAILGNYFSAMWGEWNWANFIFATIQVACWVGTGIVQLYDNYSYVVIDKVNKLKRKKELIQKFKYGCEQGLYVTEA